MIPYIVGCLILVAATTLTNVVYEIAMVNGGPILEEENPEKSQEENVPTIKEEYYCKNCGSEFLKCSCKNKKKEKGYKCTVCGERIKKKRGEVYCYNCGVGL